MPTIKILNRWDQRTIAEGDFADLRDAVLSDADLRGADLRDAVLSDADLRGADLRDAVLSGAVLRGADLRGADLRGADLRGAVLRGADLRGADLRGAKLPWQSHDMIAHLLLRAAGDDVGKRMVAGFILVSRDYCWGKFLALADRPEFGWAIGTLAAHVVDGDGAPKILADRAAALKAAPAPAFAGEVAR